MDPATWRHVELYLPSDAGAVGGFEIDLLRPTLWIEQVGARVGGSIWLALPEMGVEGPAEVLSVKPCPEIQPGPGRVVTGTFRSAGTTVLQLRVEGLAEPIGATGAHPFWSEDRLAYVPAGELRPGELLRTLDSAAPAAVSIRPLPGVHRVYNLEVEAEHTFWISDLRLLCHNACPGARFVADSSGNVIDTAATPPGRYIQPDGSATDILQKADHPHPNRFVQNTHTHPSIVHQNPADPARRSIKLSRDVRPVSPEEARNIMDGIASRSRPKGC